MTGPLFKHYKGGVYEVLTHALWGGDGDQMLLVVYRQKTTGTTFVRSASEFYGTVDGTLRRFTPIS